MNLDRFYEHFKNLCAVFPGAKEFCRTSCQSTNPPLRASNKASLAYHNTARSQTLTHYTRHCS